MLSDVAPNLIDLNALAGKAAHLLIHDAVATLADFNPKPHDRVAVSFAHPFGRANRIAFDQAIDDLGAAGE